MLVSVKNLTFRYPDAHKPALKDVSLELRAGEYIAVLGANGSGKSTLARCVATLLETDSLSVSFNVPDGRVPVALVFQTPADQLVAETVELDVAFGPENLGLNNERMHRVVSTALESFNLSLLAQSPVHSLPSGRKQHLALAGVRALDPALFVLDEPTSMLSPPARRDVLDVLDRFHAEGGSVMHVTHDLDEAYRASRVLVLEDGSVVFDGTPEDLMAVYKETLVRWGLAYKGESPPQAEHMVKTPLVRVRNLCRGPVQDLSFDIVPGTITMITGDSGTGKTLLLEMLAGLARPESGTIELESASATALAVQESEASLFAEFVADDVAFGPRNAGLSGKALVDRVHQAMELVGLPFDVFAERRTFTLSGGERRKAALAGIIAMDTPVVLLDEPSSALDVKSRGSLLDLLLALRAEGKAVICTTNRDEECAIADRVLHLDWPSEKISVHPPASASPPGTKDQAMLEKLRSGSAGSYRKLDTPIHRLSPLTKYLLAASFVAAALAVTSWPCILLLIAIETVPVLFSRLPGRTLARSFFRVLPWLLLFGAIQLYLNPTDLYAPGIFILRFVALLIPLSVFVFTTGHTEIMYGMEDSLSILRLVHVPVRDLALVTGIVFRFVGLLYEEAARITAARIVRGAGRSSARSSRLSTRIVSMASLFVPLILRTLTRAERLAQAITARYYGTHVHSRYLHWHISRGEHILRVALPLGACAFIYLSFVYGT